MRIFFIPSLLKILIVFSNKGGKALLSIGNITTGNFCLTSACNYETENDIAQWEVMVSVL